jgi:SAM-dependent methyltransferase
MTSLNNMTGPDSCTICGAPGMSVFFEIPQVPLFCNVLWPTREAALQRPRGDIRLGFCSACGFIANLAFQPGRIKYAPTYENSLHFSAHFQKYADELATYLVDRHDLHGKDLIAIGCGRGDFLLMLCKLGGNRGVGFDPSFAGNAEMPAAGLGVRFVREEFSARHADYPCDFLCSRHLLEHIPAPKPFLAEVKQAIGGRRSATVFFEVPNVMFTLQDLGIWDIIYEHCSYFCRPSLDRLFTSCGFQVQALRDSYDGQFLCIEAAHREDHPENRHLDFRKEVEHVARCVASFRDSYLNKVGSWRRTLAEMKRHGRRAAVWGAGSKGVTFLNTLKDLAPCDEVVDINPRKQGMYVPGTGQQVIAPEQLRQSRPEVILVMNPVYQEEIAGQIAELGVSAEIQTV